MRFRKSAYQFFVRGLISLGGFMNAGCVRRTRRELGMGHEPYGFTVTENIVFTPDEWDCELQGDLYLPDINIDLNCETESDLKTLPVVLLVHGGGWAENDNRYQMKKLAQSIVQEGFAVFSITYRLAPEYVFPTQVDDLLEAVNWLSKNACTHQLNLQKTIIYGYSAGGHLAELAAIRKEEMPEDVRIRAVVAGGAPHFMRLDPDYPLVQQFMGHSWQENVDRYREATPVDAVTEGFPPAFIYHGAKDVLCPSPHVEKWEARLLQLGIEHAIHWVKGKGHIGTFLAPRDAVIRAIQFMHEKIEDD